MITKPTTVGELLDYWPGDIPFKGRLVSDDGCMCAQGQALHFLKGFTVEELRIINQDAADKEVAKLFDISLAHSILLRLVNDNQPGAPACVIRNPEQVLGDQAQAVLAFWWHLDRMTPAAWATVGAAPVAAAEVSAWKAAREAAEAAAWKAAREAAEAAAGLVAKEAVWKLSIAEARLAPVAAAWATNEIQGAAVMRANNQPFFFLPLFGFPDPEAVIAPSL